VGAEERRPVPGGSMRSPPFDPALLAELLALYADYASALDERRFDDWAELFTEDCRYLLQPRENHERGLPLATMRLEGRGMLKDRAYGVTHTLFHAPYYQRHVFGLPRLLSDTSGAAPGSTSLASTSPGSTRWQIEIAYSVFRTRMGEVSEVFSVGRHLDTVVREPGDPAGRLRFADKAVVFDSEMVLNSIIYPL
jgi:salicylate 5-hydroxylase small subunit